MLTLRALFSRASGRSPAPGRGRWPVAALVITLTAASCSGSGGQLVLEGGGSTGSDPDGPAVTDPAPDWLTDRSSDPTWVEEPAGAPPPDTGPQAAGPIRIDQFGYRPGDPKVAVIADPQVGYDADVDYEASERYQLRRVSDDAVVFEGAPEPWSDGAVHDQSGDRGWWFDFSAVDQPGSYYITDEAQEVATGPFDIADDVYDAVLHAALRAFWWNRANTPHPPEHAGPWADDAAYVGPEQDTEARSVDARSDPSTARDLSGGWFDAGDPNKYVTFAAEPVHVLLTAYETAPGLFDDTVGIPESSNGIPDIIDEVRWEIDWLERMQEEDGGVLTKVGVVEWVSAGVPSQSPFPRYYEKVCSSSTIAASGMFAHAALVFASVPELAAEAPRLRERAESAWQWYQTNQKRDDCDQQIVKAGDADWSLPEQRNAEVVAAVYLFALTGQRSYDDVVQNGYAQTVPLSDDGFGRYSPEQADALLVYRDTPGADPATVAALDRHLEGIVAISATYGFDPEASLYRSFMPDAQYHWGSNRVKASIGSANLMIDGVPAGRERALDHLHYFHGVNPLATVYLSNMEVFGAERSVERLFHYWFGENTAFDVEAGSEIGVAPGFVVGGPNGVYSGRESPPAGQPPLKSYRDQSWDGSEPTWETTEPGIYYQAAYVRLLSEVLSAR